jgi:hypothetical protein
LSRADYTQGSTENQCVWNSEFVQFHVSLTISFICLSIRMNSGAR